MRQHSRTIDPLTHIRNLVTSLWYITQALGNLIQIAVALIDIPLSTKFFAYFAAVFALVLLFALLNRKFVYRDQLLDSESQTDSLTESQPLISE